MLQLLTAVGIGLVLSARPWRLAMKRPLPRTEMIQAQILLCAAAAVITAVIGNSVAKAFGLVGLGGFVRFRSGLKDPRDAAILFLVIGLGMACGHADLRLALAGSLFVACLLFAVDLFTRGEGPPQRMKLSALADDLTAAEVALRKSMGEKNVLVTGAVIDSAARRLELDLEEREPGGVASALANSRLAMLREVRWTSLGPKSQKEDLV
ncbi:MAG: DUF4956 domain-containing protein [Myxococcales bacterium]|nr:DUF4956 domain-containing protein [Myxococcales bacterium]